MDDAILKAEVEETTTKEMIFVLNKLIEKSQNSMDSISKFNMCDIEPPDKWDNAHFHKYLGEKRAYENILCWFEATGLAIEIEMLIADARKIK